MVIHEVDCRIVVDVVAGKAVANCDALQLDGGVSGHLGGQRGHVHAGVALA